MLIQDLSFIERTEENGVNGGAAAVTDVDVLAIGPKSRAEALGFGFGDSTSANTRTSTKSKLADRYAISTATGAATAYGVTRDGKDSKVATSVSTGVATSVFTR